MKARILSKERQQQNTILEKGGVDTIGLALAKLESRDVNKLLSKDALDKAAKEAEAAADTLVFQKKMVDDALDKARPQQTLKTSCSCPTVEALCSSVEATIVLQYCTVLYCTGSEPLLGTLAGRVYGPNRTTTWCIPRLRR